MKAEIKPDQRNLEEFAGSWRSQHGIINYMAFYVWCFLREISLVLTGRFIQVIQISLFYIGRYFLLLLALSAYASNLRLSELICS